MKEKGTKQTVGKDMKAEGEGEINHIRKAGKGRKSKVK